jgi:hypothetical protein
MVGLDACYRFLAAGLGPLSEDEHVERVGVLIDGVALAAGSVGEGE